MQLGSIARAVAGNTVFEKVTFAKVFTIYVYIDSRRLDFLQMKDIHEMRKQNLLFTL